MIDIPKTLHSEREHARVHAQGRRTDDNSRRTLLVIHETNGSWAIHGLGAPGVRLPTAEMIALAESILGRAPVSAPHPHPWGVLHLLVADDALTEGHVYRCYLALCGALLPTPELPPSSCPEDCECDVLYCSECVRAAAQWTAEAQQAERASGALR